jgi:hypothetical protein
MPDLDIEVDSNIKEVSTDVKGLNKDLNDTDKAVDKTSKSAKGFGDNMKTAAKAFLVGSAFRLGVSAIKNDMAEVHESAIGIVRSLKEIDFLKGKAGKQTVRDIARELNLTIEEVAAVAGPVFSANPNMDLGQLKNVIKNAFAEQKTSGAPALDLAKGTSGLLNSSSTFQDNGAGEVGAQNFIVKTTEQSNMSTRDVGLLAPMFATAATLDISPFEASAAFEIVVASDIKPAEAVTMIKTLMIQWSIYGKPEGMSLIEFIVYAVGIKDAKKRNTVIPGASAGIAAGTINIKGASAFNAGVAKFKEAGSNRESSSIAAFNEKIQGDAAFRGEQLTAALDNQMQNRDQKGSTTEKNAVAIGIGSQIMQGLLAVLKTGVELSPGGLALQASLGIADPLGAQGNVETLVRSGEIIENRGNSISLDKLNSTMGALKSDAETNNVKANP